MSRCLTTSSPSSSTSQTTPLPSTWFTHPNLTTLHLQNKLTERNPHLLHQLLRSLNTLSRHRLLPLLPTPNLQQLRSPTSHLHPPGRCTLHLHHLQQESSHRDQATVPHLDRLSTSRGDPTHRSKSTRSLRLPSIRNPQLQPKLSHLTSPDPATSHNSLQSRPTRGRSLLPLLHRRSRSIGNPRLHQSQRTLNPRSRFITRNPALTIHQRYRIESYQSDLTPDTAIVLIYNGSIMAWLDSTALHAETDLYIFQPSYGPINPIPDVKVVKPVKPVKSVAPPQPQVADSYTAPKPTYSQPPSKQQYQVSAETC